MNERSSRQRTVRTRSGRPRRPRRFRRRSALVALLLVSLSGLVVTAIPPAAAVSDCATTAANGYFVTVCLTISAADGTAALSGTVPVQATVTTQGMPSGTRVQKVVFCSDSSTCANRSDGYLITDWSGVTDSSGGSSYGFGLDTSLYADDPSTTVRAFAQINDGTVAAPAAVTVSFANNQSGPPPVPTGFQVHRPTVSDGLVVAAVGDGAGGEPSETTVASLMQSWNPDLVAYLGDVYEKGTPEEFTNWYAQFGFGAMKSITNPTIGNHEYSGDAAAEGYFRYWENPPHYYSYDVGGWHLVSLDSTSQFARSVTGVDQDQPSTVDGVTTQYDWLASDLATHAGACTLVYYHHPRWNQGEEGASTRLDALWKLLADQRVSVVLNGHDHDYQRFAALDRNGNPDASGVTELIVGGGGHGTQTVTPGSQPGPDPVLYASGLAATKLTLHPDRADFETVSPNGSTGKLVDAGSVACQGPGPDTQAPTAPVLTASTSLQDNLPEVSLTWQPATDDRGVSAYDVVRDGTLVASVPGSAASWSDARVVGGASYRYVVRARDVWGNTTPSNEVSVTTPLPTSDPAPATLLADTYVASSSPSPKGAGDRLRVKEDGSTTYVTYVKYDLTRFSGQIARATLRMTPTTSTSSRATAYAVADTTWSEAALGWPGPARGAAGGSTTGLVSGVPVDIDVTGLVKPGTVNALALAETSGTSTQAYYSKEGSASGAPQLLVSIVVPADTQAPTVPSNLTGTASTETAIDLSWDASTDDRGVDHYVVYRDGTPYDQVSGDQTRYTDSVVGPGQTWHYRVAAVDRAGNSSSPTDPVAVTVPDLAAPSAASPAVRVMSAFSALVSWNAAEDNVGIAGYRVFRDGTQVAQLDAGARQWNDTGLSPETSYVYGISAFDAAGNASPIMSADPVTTPPATPDTTAPTVPGDLNAVAKSGSTVDLTWSASSDDSAVVSYTVLRNGAAVGSSTSSSYTDSGLVSASTYTWAVDAVDAAGNRSDSSTPVTLTTPDDVPPAPPASLDVSADSYRLVSLGWPASTDNVGVTGYDVYRDGTLLDRTTSMTYQDNTAPIATDVVYAVAARDAAGNESPPTRASFTTPAPQTDDTGWLTVDDSGYVQSGTSASTNYRHANDLKVGGGSTQRVSYLKVKVPARVLPALDHLYLQLNTSTTSNGFDVHQASSNTWDRTTLTWNNQPGWSVAIVASSGAIAQTGTVPAPPGVIDLARVITGPGTYSFVLTTSLAKAQTYSSSDTDVADALRPKVRWISHD